MVETLDLPSFPASAAEVVGCTKDLPRTLTGVVSTKDAKGCISSLPGILAGVDFKDDTEGGAECLAYLQAGVDVEDTKGRVVAEGPTVFKISSEESKRGRNGS